MELSGHKKTPVRNRGFVPGRSEVVQPLRSRASKVHQINDNRKVNAKNIGHDPCVRKVIN